ncbi:hypothetical protein AWENTII_002032 [Aspergillus wentii]|nr:hypothetical protein MW887_009356 [Aspergillus wentii]
MAKYKYGIFYKGKKQRSIRYKKQFREGSKGAMIPSMKIQAMAFSPEGSLLARGNSDRSVRVFDTMTRNVRAHFEGQRDRTTILGFFTGNGETIASVTVKGRIGV